MQTSRSIQYSLIVLTVIVITSYFLVLTYAYNNFGDELVEMQKKYLDKISNKSQKIFIIGNSLTYTINPERIEKSIEDKKYEVFNLSIGGYGLEQRVRTIDILLEKNPKIVVIGLSFRDFSTGQREINIESDLNQIFPSPKGFWKEFTDEIIIKLPYVESPRYFFHKFLFGSHDFDFKEQNTNFDSKTPFLILSEENFQNNPQKDFVVDGYSIKNLNDNTRIKFVEYIVKKFEKNGVRVIIISSPVSKIENDSISEENLQNYNDILNYLSATTDVKILDLREKYSQLEIWRDQVHMVFGTPADIYTDEIIKILKEEI